VKKPSFPAGPPHWADLVACAAVLATGILQIAFGHPKEPGMTTVLAALVGFYAAWGRSREP
jgi:hypothetical protein